MGAFSLVVILLCSAAVYLSVLINDCVKKLDSARRPLLDKKSKMVSDSILSIKNIKFNAWENLIKEKLHQVRKTDSGFLLGNFTLQGVSAALVAMISSFTGLFCVGYVKLVLEREMGVVTVYIILLYLNYLKKQMIFSNLAFIEINSCLVSFERIRAFLRIDDFGGGKEVFKSPRKPKIEDEDRIVVNFSCCTASWTNTFYRSKVSGLEEKGRKEGDRGKIKQNKVMEPLKKAEKLCLKKIDFCVQKGKFVAVIGQVGAGKTSLLRTALGDVNVVSGGCRVTGSVAYIPQEAFLINDSLQNNILFGKPFNEEKYNRILDISQLRPDLEILAEGDLTEIGERGLNLSGGQKQRISIARALYSDSDIYLVDDCMSALDSHVGGAIPEKVFFGYLKGKTVVMTTHRYHFLDRVDRVCVLKDGELIAEGPYGEIKHSQEMSLLAKIQKEEEEHHQEEVKKQIKKKNKREEECQIKQKQEQERIPPTKEKFSPESQNLPVETTN